MKGRRPYGIGPGMTTGKVSGGKFQVSRFRGFRFPGCWRVSTPQRANRRRCGGYRIQSNPQPVEVRITPEELAVLSFPGPDRSIRLADLRRGKAVSRRYRNRRIGEFLKELDLTEGRATGIPKILRAMQANGSPPARFETDDDRTSFLIRLPVHPKAERTGGSYRACPWASRP